MGRTTDGRRRGRHPARPLEEALQGRLGRYVRRVGIEQASIDLGASRESLLRAAAGLAVQGGTCLAVSIGLAAHDREGAAGVEGAQ